MGSYEDIADASAILGTLFYRDPRDARAHAVLQWLTGEDAAATWGFGAPRSQRALEDAACAFETEGLDEIHAAYNRFFVGPYKLPAPPWGSVYTDPESVIFGNETLAVRQWMRDNLVKVTLEEREPEDQFGLMLLMVSWAVTHGVSDDQIARLFEDDLLPWAYRFLDLLVDAASGGQAARRSWGDEVAPSHFYAAIGRCARATLEDWQSRYGWTPKDVPLSR